MKYKPGQLYRFVYRSGGVTIIDDVLLILNKKDFRREENVSAITLMSTGSWKDAVPKARDNFSAHALDAYAQNITLKELKSLK